jgi:hypothetical protein
LRIRNHALGASGSPSRAAVDLEVLGIFHGQFGTQNATGRRVRFVIQLDGVVVVAVFDPHALLASLQVTGHFCDHMARDFTRSSQLLAQEAKYVGAAECGHRVMYE